jgi:hypothetical protein
MTPLYTFSVAIFPGHATMALPRFRETNHYYCVNALAYTGFTYSASTR